MSVPTAATVRALASATIEAGPRLFAAGAERRARWLADAFARLAGDGPFAREARPALAESAGLSEPMVAWALESALAPLTYDALRTLEQRPVPPHPGARRARPGQLCAVVIAGNVVTGAARAVAWPLLFGWPVLAKASSHDSALAYLLERALTESDPELAGAYRAVDFAADDAPSAVLFEQADIVSAYGSDATLRAIRDQLGANVAFIGHGHGLGAAVVARPALELARAPLSARALAFDVAAYDQRGCLSPHVAWVEQGGAVSPESFAQLVFEELATLRNALPRGPLPTQAGVAQLSWRGIGALRGTLLEGEGFAVTFEERGPPRVGPGYRNLQLLALGELTSLPAQLAPFGPHLKCLGIAGLTDVEALARALPPLVAPRLCPLGEMQRPPVHALQDARPAWEGLVRWVDVGEARASTSERNDGEAR